MQRTNFSLKKLLKISLLTKLSLFGFWASAQSSATEAPALSNIERVEVGQILDIQRVQSERRFYEKLATTLCKEKGSEQMFPDVCGVAKEMLRNMNNGVRPSQQRRVETEVQAKLQEPTLPPLPSPKSVGYEKSAELKGSPPGRESVGGGYPAGAVVQTYRLLGVYGEEDDLQAELKSGSGRHYLIGMNSRVGKFRVLEIFAEGIEIQISSNEKADRIFVAVGSLL